MKEASAIDLIFVQLLAIYPYLLLVSYVTSIFHCFGSTKICIKRKLSITSLDHLDRCDNVEARCFSLFNRRKVWLVVVLVTFGFTSSALEALSSQYSTSISKICQLLVTFLCQTS